MKIKYSQKFKQLSIAVLLMLALLGRTNHSMAAGVGAGIDLGLIDNIFVGADAFSNYYGDNIISYNYGVKGSLGYKMAGVSVYGLGGVQHVGFANNAAKNFKGNTSPLYGFGVGYNFPLINIGVRLNKTYFNLDRNNGNTDHFGTVDLGLVLAF